jgi:hypothetical protein
LRIVVHRIGHDRQLVRVNLRIPGLRPCPANDGLADSPSCHLIIAMRPSVPCVRERVALCHTHRALR